MALTWAPRLTSKTRYRRQFRTLGMAGARPRHHGRVSFLFDRPDDPDGLAVGSQVITLTNYRRVRTTSTHSHAANPAPDLTCQHRPSRKR
jgi:hypothetical protein